MLPTLRYAAALAVAGLASTMCGEITKTFSNDCDVNPTDPYQWDYYNLVFDHSQPARCPIRIISGAMIPVSGTWTDYGVPDFLTGMATAVNQNNAEVVRESIMQFQLDDGLWRAQAALLYPAATGTNPCKDMITEEMKIYANGQPVLNRYPLATVTVTYTWNGDVPHCDPDGGGDNMIVPAKNRSDRWSVTRRASAPPNKRGVSCSLPQGELPDLPYAGKG